MLLIKCLEPAFIQRQTDLFHQGVIKIQIVQNRQTHAQHLPCLEQVMQISTGKAPAHRAIGSVDTIHDDVE